MGRTTKPCSCLAQSSITVDTEVASKDGLFFHTAALVSADTLSSLFLLVYPAISHTFTPYALFASCLMTVWHRMLIL
ncbi:hypothetical protein BDR04DRAFT_1104212 [Suillus decipiens]|nr:hypothetical protein BDR04DRAFT_1104212 [Suillus decipiens]